MGKGEAASPINVPLQDPSPGAHWMQEAMYVQSTTLTLVLLETRKAVIKENSL